MEAQHPQVLSGEIYEVIRIDHKSLPEDLTETHPVVKFWRSTTASGVECIILRDDYLNLFCVVNPDPDTLSGRPQVAPDQSYLYIPARSNALPRANRDISGF